MINVILLNGNSDSDIRNLQNNIILAVFIKKSYWNHLDTFLLIIRMCFFGMGSSYIYTYIYISLWPYAKLPSLLIEILNTTSVTNKLWLEDNLECKHHAHICVTTTDLIDHILSNQVEHLVISETVDNIIVF
jgi:hypothetical protein